MGIAFLIKTRNYSYDISMKKGSKYEYITDYKRRLGQGKRL